ncbi:hypothetical protein [Sedimentitalea todarodis]|uniref:Uncharacterized protein n=1 Tax=Sedimentitalea todarodis TaxID=1631240 RepID=A0ABU3VLX5_9RHOB|nr:hypothetical protein [Sedimentitalea todarodis]MDU9007187.1 hypothetical protein [Sedimentitalea todarodis]
MTFNPAQHGFFELDFAFPGGVAVYELDLQGVDQNQHDTMRLNCYLSQDGDFVTVWYGLLDAHMTEISLGFADDPTLDFNEQYEETLFRGYIADNETGVIILKALRLDYQTPNILVMPEKGRLECHLLKAS